MTSTVESPLAPGLAPEMAATVRALKLIAFDFDGVFTDNLVYVFQDGREAVRCSRADGIGLRRLEQVGVIPVILSTEVNPVVSMRASKLRVRCIQGIEVKRAALDKILGEYCVNLEQTAFVGNDVNDLECLQAVTLPIVVRDAHPEVLAVARYRTRAPGGNGAVREICDLVYHLVRNEAVSP